MPFFQLQGEIVAPLFTGDILPKYRIFLYIFLSFKFFIGMQTVNSFYIENKCNHLRREKNLETLLNIRG